MGIKDILPNKLLADYIKCFRVIHMLPTTSIYQFSKFYVPKPEMVLHSIIRGVQKIRPSTDLTNELTFKCFVSGQQTQPFTFYNNGELLNFQIVFAPTAFFNLIKIPSCELTNTFIDADLIFGNSIKSYFEKLEIAESSAEMIKIAEAFILNVISKQKVVATNIDGIFRRNLPYVANMTVDKLAKENCLCEKQFKRTFKEKIGVNPKMYLSIVRFYKAYNIKNANPQWDWLRIAVECGYYDYQHICKEYLYFTSHTPVQYHKQIESQSPEILLGIAEQIYYDRFKKLELY